VGCILSSIGAAERKRKEKKRKLPVRPCGQESRCFPCGAKREK